mgnify:CR=1 FL=1
MACYNACMSKKSQSIQAKFRKETFSVHQYWSISYTERYEDGTEKDFKTFIKAKSYELAKHFLTKRLQEDNPFLKVKSIQGFMLHKDFKSSIKGVMGIKQWGQVRSASFPNIHNVLFKHEVPRPEGYTNRFNKTDEEHVKKIGFKKGEKNWSTLHRKGRTLPINQREGMIYVGKWVKWDKALMEHTRNQLISSLVSNGNNRSKAAESLGVSRHKFYDLLKRFPSINWMEDYPAPAPDFTRERGPKVSQRNRQSMLKRMSDGHKPFDLSRESEEKRVQSLLSFHNSKLNQKMDKWEPLIRTAFEENGNIRRKSAEYLGIKVSYLSKLMKQLKSRVDWLKEYPPPSGVKKIKNA